MNFLLYHTPEYFVLNCILASFTDCGLGLVMVKRHKQWLLVGNRKPLSNNVRLQADRSHNFYSHWTASSLEHEHMSTWTRFPPLLFVSGRDFKTEDKYLHKTLWKIGPQRHRAWPLTTRHINSELISESLWYMSVKGEGELIVKAIYIQYLHWYWLGINFLQWLTSLFVWLFSVCVTFPAVVVQAVNVPSYWRIMSVMGGID